MSKSPSNIFDFVAQLKFYAAYHHNVINKWIHIVCVPQILWTSMVFLAYVGPLVTIDSIPKYIEINIPLILVLLTSIYFIILNTIAGTTYSILLVVMWYTATLFYHTPDAWKIALFLNVASWIAQFIGHGVFEGRKPTLLDNLFQALLLAPFFVWVEILFTLGWNANLNRQLEEATVKDIAEWKASLSKKAT